jgi:phage shock protein C
LNTFRNRKERIMGGGKYYYQRSRRRNNRFQDIFRRGLYRSRKGVIFGVCRGIADYFNFSVFWIRIITVALFLITGFWPTGILYILAALILKPEPVVPGKESNYQRSYNSSYEREKEMRTDRFKNRFSNLERRIRRLEHSVTTSEFDWENRLNS